MSLETETSPRGRLLIVDDDPVVLSQLQWALARGFEVVTARGPEEAVERARQTHPDVATLDLAFEENDPQGGFRLLDQLTELDPALKVVFITGNDTHEHALQAVSQGAFDFLPKPVDFDHLEFLLSRAVAIRRLERENARRARLVSGEAGLGDLLGQCPPMRRNFHLIQRVAPTQAPVLITGARGTGKELAAREIHRLSPRAEAPFMTVSCGARTDFQLDTEIFGQEKGAGTGAHVRQGRLEMAEGGTVLLDEVAGLSPVLQHRILRLLEEKVIERVGGRRPVPLNLRVLATSSADLAHEVAAGRFREDLHSRLSVVVIHLPNLAERGLDVVLLALSFLERSAAACGRKGLSFATDALHALQDHNWPGNVRELERRVERAVILCAGRQIRARDLDLEVRPPSLPSLREARRDADRQILVEALRQNHGNVSRAARTLGISRPTFHELARKLDIHPGEFRGEHSSPDADNWDQED